MYSISFIISKSFVQKVFPQALDDEKGDRMCELSAKQVQAARTGRYQLIGRSLSHISQNIPYPKQKHSKSACYPTCRPLRKQSNVKSFC